MASKNPEEELNYLSSPWKTLRFAISPNKGKFFLMCLLIIIGHAIGNSLPYFYKRIADTAVAHIGTPSFNDFLSPLIFIVGALVIAEIFYRTAHIIEGYTATDSFRHITGSLYAGLIKRPTSYFEDKFSGDLSRRINQIGNTVLYFIASFPWEVGWILTTFGMAIVLLSATHIYVLSIFLGWLLFFIITSIPLLLWHYRASEKSAFSHAQLSGGIVDALGNVPLIHSFGGISYEERLNRDSLNEVTKADLKRKQISVANKLQQGLSVIILTVSLVLVSILLFTQGEFSLGDFVVVVAIIPSVAGVIWAVGEAMLQTSQYFGELSDAVLHLKEKQEQLIGGSIALVKQANYSIDFDDVSFTYPATTTPVFKDFSLNILQGERTGIVGVSGAGKSTLVKLLLRHYGAGSGTISIGGIAIEEFTLDTFNKLISYVPQDTSLFHRTLFENIHYANPVASKEQVFSASKQAHAHEFIMNIPEGYEAKVGERGVKLSGGQRQRIALARAILKNAPILVLDEATSSLDSESESVIQEALSELFKNRTVIAVAHRLSTLKAMDRIVVMKEGTIIESGNPQELLKKSDGVFKQMWEHQKNGFI